MESLFCGHLDVYSETWPTSGMTVSGVAYEQPTWEPHTADSESLSSPHDETLFLTPVASEGTKPSNVMGVARRLTTGQVFLTNQIVSLCGLDPTEQASSKLLPTPCAGDGDGRGMQHPDKRKAAGHQVQLGSVAEYQLLPTPVAQPSGNTPENHLRKKPGREVVTDLAILVENDMLSTGGRMPLRLPDGRPVEEPPLPLPNSTPKENPA